MKKLLSSLLALSLLFSLILVIPEKAFASSSVFNATYIENTARTGAGLTFSSVTTGAGNNASTCNSSSCGVGDLDTDGTGYTENDRDIINFSGTSALGSSVIIDSVVLCLKGTSGKTTTIGVPSLGIYAATPASTSTFATGDYSQVGTTLWSSTISYSSWDVGDSACNNFTFNATGIAGINVNGTTSLATQESTMDAPRSAPTFAANSRSNIHADTNLSNVTLTVTYHLPSKNHSVIIFMHTIQNYVLPKSFLTA